MPLYEYKCESCGEKFEVIQKFSDAPVEVHEKCGGHVERLISTSALQFKGSGWYVNDYGSGNGKSQSSKDGKDGKDGKKEAKSESSSSTESASKTETKTSSNTPATTSDKKV
jgi:putative FmdB family regulatory protein